MHQDLRKGQSSVYLQYESGSGDTIGPEQFEVALERGSVAIMFHLELFDGNQRIDERCLRSETLTQVHLRENNIIENLAQFLKQPYVKAQEMLLQVVSRGKSLDYTVSVGAAGLKSPPLLVQRFGSKKYIQAEVASQLGLTQALGRI
ncbi:hypothetical protein [Xanthomonas campestris]|uniref:hypothetical protein n=1 Tax=Xanthomonas campestris TaxID=339 RepID=UPI001E38AB72|nr:hypothetical protein [Xanthomonas campestris]MCC5086431.1 hypothetical protein [Xanthomonas campestris]